MNRISNSNPNILYILSIHVRSAHLVHYGHGFYAYRADALQQVDYPLLVAGEAVGVLNLAAMVGSRGLRSLYWSSTHSRAERLPRR